MWARSVTSLQHQLPSTSISHDWVSEVAEGWRCTSRRHRCDMFCFPRFHGFFSFRCFSIEVTANLWLYPVETVQSNTALPRSKSLPSAEGVDLFNLFFLLFSHDGFTRFWMSVLGPFGWAEVVSWLKHDDKLNKSIAKNLMPFSFFLTCPQLHVPVWIVGSSLCFPLPNWTRHAWDMSWAACWLWNDRFQEL